MDKKEFAKLKVGDKVRIVSKRTGGGWCLDGSMDKWLGKVMTIKKFLWDGLAFMEEDQGENPDAIILPGWLWSAEMIAEKIEPIKEVKRKAKVGEWIKIVNPRCPIGYKKGDIKRVTGLYRSAIYDQLYPEFPVIHGETIHVYDSEYVALENYIPEDKSTAKPESKKPEEQPVTIVEHLVKDRKTIVKLSNGKVGVAVCSPEDEFDIYEGLRLATARAYGKAEPYKKSKPVNEVKRKAKVGEWIKIVNKWPIEFRYQNGDIFKVIGLSGAGNAVINSGFREECCVLDTEYVVLENYKPTK